MSPDLWKKLQSLSLTLFSLLVWMWCDLLSCSTTSLRCLQVFSSCWLPPCGWGLTWELLLLLLCCQALQSCSPETVRLHGAHNSRLEMLEYHSRVGSRSVLLLEYTVTHVVMHHTKLVSNLQWVEAAVWVAAALPHVLQSVLKVLKTESRRPLLDKLWHHSMSQMVIGQYCLTVSADWFISHSHECTIFFFTIVPSQLSRASRCVWDQDPTQAWNTRVKTHQSLCEGST